jgi:integrase
VPVEEDSVTTTAVKEGERFGFHNFRHSLSTWVNKEFKDITISQGFLRHSKPDITATVYTHGVPEQNLRAQEQYMAALALQKPYPGQCSSRIGLAIGWIERER